MLVESGALVQRPAGWIIAGHKLLERVPATIRTLIAARLDGLPADEARAAGRRSVVGDLGPALRRRLGSGGGAVCFSGSWIEICSVDDRARVAGAREYVFKHVLIRDVAYESLPGETGAAASSRRASCGRTRVCGGRFSGARVPLREAWRLSRSRAAGTVDQDLARLAAEVPRPLGGQDVYLSDRLAESLYGRPSARDSIEGRSISGCSPGCRSDEPRASSSWAGIEAADPANDAQSLATRTGDEHLEARALPRLGASNPMSGTTSSPAACSCRRWHPSKRSRDVGGQAWANHRLSEAWSREDYTRELEHMRQTYLLFERAGDRWGRAVAAQDLAYLLTTVGGEEFHHWHQRARRLVEARATGHWAAVLRTWGYFSYFCGAYGEAIRAMREVRPIAIEAGHRYTSEYVPHRGDGCVPRGAPKEAGRLAAEVVRIGRAIRSVRIPALGLAAGARACLGAGDPSRATRQLSRPRRTLQRSGARMRGWKSTSSTPGSTRPRELAARGRTGGAGGRQGPRQRMDAVRSNGAATGRSGTPGRRPLRRGVRRAGASGRVAAGRRRDGNVRARGGSAGPGASDGRPPAGLMPEGAREIEVEAIVAESDGLALFAGRTEAATAAFALAVQRWQQLGSRSAEDVPVTPSRGTARRVGDLRQAGGFAPRRSRPRPD